MLELIKILAATFVGITIVFHIMGFVCTDIVDNPNTRNLLAGTCENMLTLLGLFGLVALPPPQNDT